MHGGENLGRGLGGVGGDREKESRREKAAKHDEQEDMKKDREIEASGDISKLVMMPAGLKREMVYLVLTVHKAEEAVSEAAWLVMCVSVLLWSPSSLF